MKGLVLGVDHLSSHMILIAQMLLQKATVSKSKKIIKTNDQSESIRWTRLNKRESAQRESYRAGYPVEGRPSRNAPYVGAGTRGIWLCNTVRYRIEEMRQSGHFGSIVRPKCAW